MLPNKVKFNQFLVTFFTGSVITISSLSIRIAKKLEIMYFNNISLIKKEQYFYFHCNIGFPISIFH